jgi:hypothetical protein
MGHFDPTAREAVPFCYIKTGAWFLLMVDRKTYRFTGLLGQNDPTYFCILD